jgi:hypothetical protein
VLAQIVRHFLDVKDDRNVEEGEEDNQRKKDQLVIWITCVERLEESVYLGPRGVGLVRIGGKGCKQTLRHRQHRGREDYGDNATHVDLERHCRLLPTNDLPADVALGITDWDLTPGSFHKDNKRDDQNHGDEQTDHADCFERIAAANAIENLLNAIGESDYDTGKNQQRNAVADTSLGDLFSQPHDEDGAGGQR